MATFYLDYEGGSDGADGTTFANRWKTFTNGATAARIAPNDTIRVMGSPAPTSLGINATWTNKSATVTLASALNALITNCDSAWTASANVTSTADTTIYRTSTGSAKHVIAAGFTTGLASYFATGTIDLSAYQGITLWVYVTVKTLAAGELSIRLCSDAAGVTTVNTLALPAISQLSQWVPVYIDNGAALGASIASVALYGDTDNGAITVNLDNISTTKAAGDDCLTLQSLIGKNTTEEPYWALRGISGTTLTLDITPSMVVSTTNRGYYGTTETVTTYKRETIKTGLAAASTNIQSIMDSGTAGNLITFSGGWNRTDMSTQTLETWFDGQSGSGRGIHGVSRSFIKIEKIHTVRYDIGFFLETSSASWEFSGIIYSANFLSNGLYYTSADLCTFGTLIFSMSPNSGLGGSVGSRLTFTKIVAKSCGQAGVNTCLNVPSNGQLTIGTLEAYNGIFNGCLLTGSAGLHGATIDTIITKDHGLDGIRLNGGHSNLRIKSIESSSNGSDGTVITDVEDVVIDTILAQSNGVYGVDASAFVGRATVGSLTTSGNTTGGVLLSTLIGRLRVLKSSLAEATKVAITSATYGLAGYASFQNFNAVTDDHRGWFAHGSGGTINSETTVRHTASGVAWAVKPLSTQYIDATNPVVVPLATLLCNTGTLVTVKVWMRRTNTGITGILRCRGGQIAGVAADVTDSIGAAIDTWEEQTITFTPSAIGVVEIDILCYGGTTYTLYFDDLSVSQA